MYGDRPTRVDKRVIYHDEVRIGGPSATYADVAPRDRTATGLVEGRTP